MNSTTRKNLGRRKRRIEKRLAGSILAPRPTPMLAARNIRYEVADRDHAVACGGIGAIHQMVQAVGLPEALNADLKLLKVHLPYHESDHVLNIGYNIVAGGTCLEDLELRRNDECYLDALGADRIPDPTTAGDFCRRFESAEQVVQLMQCVNGVRLKVWKQQKPAFFEQAILDADGTLAPTDGECKQGMDISYKGIWGYHPLLVSLANTKEPLFVVNRPGNRPSHEQAGEYLDKAVELCRQGGFKKILLRGDTDFTQTAKLDGWDAGGVEFIFGMDATQRLQEMAAAMPESDWKKLERPPRYQVKTQERTKPENVKEQIVRQRGYRNLVLQCEHVMEIDYQPTLCKQSYRLVVARKHIAVEQGQQRLFEVYRYFFYLTNVTSLSTAEVVLQANDRCDQENLIQQLKAGVHAMRNPLDNLHSNWAYMAMASLAWTLKAWFGLLLPAHPGRWRERHEAQKQAVVRMEFKRFCNALVNLPCQVVRTGRRLVYRLLSYSPWTAVLLRASEALRAPLKC